MRLITKKYLIKSYELYPITEGSLKAFMAEIKAATWTKHADIKAVYPSVSFIAGTGKRYVFNIKGNDFRLVADIEFSSKLFYVVWFGPHAEYDKLDVATLRHVKID